MTIQELQHEAGRNAKDKGFNDGPVNIDRKLLMIVGEIVEAQNEMRNGHLPQEVYYDAVHLEQALATLATRGVRATPDNLPPGKKPEGFGIELADAVIRIAQLAEHVGIDLERLIELKMAYNATRPVMHGGKKF